LFIKTKDEILFKATKAFNKRMNNLSKLRRNVLVLKKKTFINYYKQTKKVFSKFLKSLKNIKKKKKNIKIEKFL
jgi:hypothetical protein